MSKEMTAEEYLNDCFFINNRTLIDEAQALEYKKLVAKEAVKEFAEELIESCIDNDGTGTITTSMIKHLAKQKGV